MLEYENEMAHADEYNYVVVNNDIDNCAKEVLNIIMNERGIKN